MTAGTAVASAKNPLWLSELFVLRGDNRSELVEQVRSWLAWLEASEPSDQSWDLKDLAFTLASDLRPGGRRLAVVAATRTELGQRWRTALERLTSTDCQQIRDAAGIYFTDQPLHPQGRIAVLFPGEGAQYLGMVGDLSAHFPEVQEVLDWTDTTAGDARQSVSRFLRYPQGVGESQRSAAEQELRKISNAMFSVLLADWALWRVLDRLGLRPDVLGGHSVGELAALWASGSMDTSKQLTTIHETMLTLDQQEVTDPEASAVLIAVGTSRGTVEEILNRLPRADRQVQGTDAAYVAMDNCPHQTVVVGLAPAMRHVEAALQRGNLIYERLELSRPYHTPLFQNYVGPMAKMLEDATFLKPASTVYSCTTAQPFPSDPREIRELALAHWYSTVEFTQMIKNMHADGCRIFVDGGPRGNLCAFIEDILRGQSSLTVAADVPRRSGLTQICHLAGQLVAHHVPLRLEVLYRGRNPRRIERRSQVIHQYQAVMSQFLDTQRQVMHQYLGGVRQARVSVLPRSRTTRGRISYRTPLPLSSVSAAASSPAVLELEPVMNRTAPPQAGTWFTHVTHHVPGREWTAQRLLSLSEDHLADHHTVGGRSVSLVDPDQHGLPVAPMTFTLELMAQAAQACVPGLVVLGLKSIRLMRWLAYYRDDPSTIEVRATVQPTDAATREWGGSHCVRIEVRDLGNRAQSPKPQQGLAASGEVVLAPQRPAAPQAGDFQLTNPRSASVTLQVLYNNLFHGSLLQGVTSLDRIGEREVEARIRVLPRDQLLASQPSPQFLVDPVTMDVVMHPLAGWHLEQPDQTGRILLPFEVQRVELFGDMLAVGDELLVRGGVTQESTRHFEHHVEAVDRTGKVWCRLTGVKLWRFYLPFSEVNFHGPKDVYFLSQEWPAALADERDTDLTDFTKRPQQPSVAGPAATCVRLEPPADLQQSAMLHATALVTLAPREMMAFHQLRMSDADKLRWIFQRIAVKDAVRIFWRRTHGPRLFMADVEVEIAADGRCTVSMRDPHETRPMPRVVCSDAEGLIVALATYQPLLGVAVTAADDSMQPPACIQDCVRQATGRASDTWTWATRGTHDSCMDWNGEPTESAASVVVREPLRVRMTRVDRWQVATLLEHVEISEL